MKLECVGFALVSLFLLAVMAPVSFGTASASVIYVNTSGWWNGPAQFNVCSRSIQSAINNATAGDLIYVYSGSYNENVIVNKSLTLEGEGADVVILTAASTAEHVFNVTADYVHLSGFKVIGATDFLCYSSNHNDLINNTANSNLGYSGILLYLSCNYNTLAGDIANFNDINSGILIWDSCYNLLDGNTANMNTSNYGGLMLYTPSSKASITDVDALKAPVCLYPPYSSGDITSQVARSSSNTVNNTLTDNVASNNSQYGLYLWNVDENVVDGNIAEQNELLGLCLESSNNNSIYNNYFNNTANAYDDGTNVWNITPILATNIIGGSWLGGNYWSDYTGLDTDGDGLGDTMRPYNASGHIQQGGDWHPLTEVATSLPDLTITGTWVGWPDNCTICYNVTNIGNGTAQAGHNTTLYVDSVEQSCDYVPVGLAQGESYTGFLYDYNWTYTSASDNITVCADYNDTVEESNEANNRQSKKWICGDSDEDGLVDTTDVVAVWDFYTKGTPLKNKWAADTALSNGMIDTSDVMASWSRYTTGSALSCPCSTYEKKGVKKNTIRE